MLLGTGVIIAEVLLIVNPFFEKSLEKMKFFFCASGVAKNDVFLYNVFYSSNEDGEIICSAI